MAMLDNSTDDLATTIGASIRARRKRLGMSMAELAQLSTLSQSFLSKVERGIGRLSMVAVDRVAKALGTSAVGLLATRRDGADVDIVRRHERPRFAAFQSGEGFGSAVTRRAGQLGLVEFEGGPDEFEPTPFVHRNDSVCLILSGTYEFELDGQVVTLREGDSVSAPGGVRERYRVLEPPGRMLLAFVSEDVDVIHNPTADWRREPSA